MANKSRDAVDHESLGQGCARLWLLTTFHRALHTTTWRSRKTKQRTVKTPLTMANVLAQSPQFGSSRIMGSTPVA